MLREFLYYAETKHIAAGQVNGADYESPFEEAVEITIRRGGYEVSSQVGVTGFRIDLGVLDPKSPGRFILGVECDGATYHSGRSARDRDRLRQEVLEGLGWKLYRIWSTDWFRNPRCEAEKLLSAVERACHESGAGVESPKPAPNTTSTDSTHFVLVPHTGNGRAAGKTALPTQLFKESAFETYKELNLQVPPGVGFFDVASKELGELVVKVVQHEGPIHIEEVARRAREAFGLGRTGRRILESISDALEEVGRQGKVARDGGFWLPINSSLKSPRCRRGAAPSLRRPDRIAPVEYGLAIEAALRAAVAASSSELTIEVARILGFDRTGPELDRAISDQIDFMIQNGQVHSSGGKIHLS
jgi:very-short-patch-repair endonuclease